ncbi:MAG TPA: Trm112 family protein [Deltaproteobacteria bacterium]|nr:Trm112 family protein [Deltaproteobacteria bacterium]
MEVKEELLKILVCPRCKGEVVLSEGDGGLVCRVCSLVYPVKDGIPVMIEEEARRLGGG